MHVQSDAIWKVQKYNLVQEYYDRPALAPPLIIFAHIFLGVRWALRKRGKFQASTKGLAFREYQPVFLLCNISLFLESFACAL